ncbi:MAG TPA: cytochrome c [Polyangiaceae bacterium]|nr:cytochrome c [Polyangiaceae bacterium]
MIKRRIKLHGFGALSIGLSAMCLALACGSEEKTPDEPDEPEVTVNDCDNPYIQDGCPDNVPDPPPEGTGGTGGTATGGSGGGGPTAEPEDDLERAQVENILRANCGACHGTQLTEATRSGGMNYINDIDELAKQEKIIPLNSDGSLVIQRMRNGTMPPAAQGGKAVAKAEIDIVANYIDNPDKWPGVKKPVCNDNPPVSFDALYRDINKDLQDVDADERQFMRYISLDNRVAAGVCADTALDTERHALTKLINMLSIDSVIVEPEIVNQKQTLFRLDLRDPQWDREITVDGVAFPDVWEAIVASNQYAVPFEGDDADDARADALTDVPVMFLDSMLDQAAIGNLYYAIIGVDITQTLDTFVSDVLNIDVVANLENEDLIRAGTTKSRISRQDRLIEGHELEDRPGVYYQSFDFNDVQNESIFQDPFGFNEGGREAIFTLPNGLLAYLIADEDGNFVQDSDILFDTSQNNFRAITSVSCSSCHASGFIPVADEVREVVLRTARVLIEDGTLDQDQLEQLSNVYLTPEAFARRIESDSDAFYLNALRRANLPLSGAEPVSTVFLRFDRDMTLKDAAADLGLSADELDQELNTLEPELSVLRRGSIDRDDFTALYVASLCTLSAVNRNQPEAAACDAAFAALDD